jgi:hypothetical protein
MKDPWAVLRDKENELEATRRQIEALRIAIALCEDEPPAPATQVKGWP